MNIVLGCMLLDVQFFINKDKDEIRVLFCYFRRGPWRTKKDNGHLEQFVVKTVDEKKKSA